MKFSVSRKEFLATLNVASAMAGKSKTIQILNCTKITINGNQMAVSSFDGDTAIVKGMPLINSDGDCSFCVNPNDLKNLLKNIAIDTIEFEYNNNVLIADYLFGQFETPTEDAVNFPTPQLGKFGENAQAIEVPSSLLIELLTLGGKYTSNDMLRPILQGIYLYVKDGEFGISATDTSKLVWKIGMNNIVGSDVNSVLSASLIPTIVESIKSEEMVTIIMSPNLIQFKNNDTKIVTRCVEGKFPNFRQVFPNDYTYEIELEKKDIIQALNLASVVGNVSKLIRFDVDRANSLLNISARDLDTQKASNNKIKCTFIKGDFTDFYSFGLNLSHLGVCLNAITSEKVRIKLNSPNKPVFVEDVNDVNKRTIVMPMIIQ